MPQRDHSAPCVLVIAGHDPCGGAGIQADIETLVSHGCIPLTVVTALTAQNTMEFAKIEPTDPSLLARQLELLLADFSIAACKIGLLGSRQQIPAICAALDRLTEMPVVVDPVLTASTGKTLVNPELGHAILSELGPRCMMVTPNTEEAAALFKNVSSGEYGPEFNKAGFDYALITGTHASTPKVINRLYHGGECVDLGEWERLPSEYHGSGCTLSSAIAAGLAHGREPLLAVSRAQGYTWQTLKHSVQLGRGQAHPNRNLDVL